jgi:hypothetical protein
MAAPLAAAAAALVAACALPAPAVGALSPLPESDYDVRDVCPPPQPGAATCLSRQLVPLSVEARAHSHPIGVRQAPVLPAPAPANGNYGLRPADLRSGYQLPSSPPSTQTIAIVDAYNDPTAEQDLKAYSEEFGLPQCTAANGCFRQVNQEGASSPLPFPKTLQDLENARKGSAGERKKAKEAEGWALEISLDIEAAHGVCPPCQILLVEAASPTNGNLFAAENSAALGADEISNSWGGPESGQDFAAMNHPGVVITASSGDDGYREWLSFAPGASGFVEYPASSRHVVAVGGTRLALTAQGAWNGETVWNDGGEELGERTGFGAGGGGCSDSLTAPAWQQGLPNWSAVGCGSGRAIADVSAVADPYTGFAVHDSMGNECSQGPEPSKHWCTVGGTSLASPIVAAAFALAGGSHGVEYPAQTLYENAAALPSALHDVVSGSNGECDEPPNPQSGASSCTAAEEAAASCSSAAICLAGSGYDGPTGVGTPAGIGAFTPGASSGGGTGGTGGGTGGGSEGGTGEAAAAGSASAGAAVPGAGDEAAGEAVPPAARAPVLSALRLTRTAVAALNRAARRVSAVGFAFTLSAAARVTATLAKGTRIHGRWHFRPVGSPQAFSARRGSQSRRLSGRATLRRGRYRLTLTPAHGSPVSIFFRIH